MSAAANGSFKYRLGLDLGTNSIGWAAVKLDEHDRPRGTLDMGVRIFSDGRNPKDGSSLAVQRRVPRGQRRRRDRYLQRRADLLDALVACGLMPPDEDARQNVARLDPYALRARALDQPITPFELGRAIFHLDQRRGFKSNRKAEQSSNETGPVKEGAEALNKQLSASKARTLGEFLYQRRRQGEPVRFRNLGAGSTAKYEFYPTRQMLLDEFHQIRSAQEQDHALRADQWDSLENIIFYQRPLKPVDPGWCLLEEGERRAARALPVAQEFRMLQEINNLKVRVGHEPERPLNDDEQARALKRLRSGKDIALRKGRDEKAASPTRDLGLPSGAVFNLARGGRNAIKGDETAVRLIKRGKKKERPAQEMFGDRWLDLSLDERNNVVRFLLDTEDPETVRRKALDDWGLDEAAADAVAEVALPTGYSNLSEKAVGKILPHLETGIVYSDAVMEAGYPSHSDFRNDQARDRIPYYGVVLERDAVGADPTKDPQKDGEPARYGRFPNPTVHIGLNQIRRVVNRLIDVYGKPVDIVVELARDLKANREQRQKHQRRQREGEERNQRFREMLESAGQNITHEALRKLRLWEEQGPRQSLMCPYTGNQLSFEMVVSSQTEIDHILPFSQTLNDSMANKVVCMVQANRDKGDRSPYEAFGRNQTGYDYEAIQSRAAALPDNKRWRFEPDAMRRFEADRDFLDRQLNETRYLSRTARKYLACLYDEQTEGKMRVRAVPGLMTALLRRGWGLEGMLRVAETGEIVRGKQRDDHRHHAIDAFVVANTTQRLLQRFARAAGSSHDTEARLTAVAGTALPWEGFDRNQLRPFLHRLVVSHKPDHGTPGQQGKTTGQLHKETAYGLIKFVENAPSQVVVRKPLSALKIPKDLESVRDPALRTALKGLWFQVGMAGGNAAEFATQAASEGVPLNGRRQRVRRVRVVSDERIIPIRPRKNRAGKPYKGYLPGGNEFADVWRMRDGSWRTIVVPTFNANRSDFDIENFRPADKKSGKPDPTARRLMRLHIDDMGALGEGAGRRIVRVRKASGGFVWLDDHNEADVANRVSKREMKPGKYSARQLQRLGFRKVGVDEIGRVLDPGPRSP